MTRGGGKDSEIIQRGRGVVQINLTIAGESHGGLLGLGGGRRENEEEGEEESFEGEKEREEGGGAHTLRKAKHLSCRKRT